MTRRGFLKLISWLTPVALFFGRLPHMLWAGKWEHSNKKFWQKDRFVQDSVDLSQYDNGLIKARIDGEWHDYALKNASPDFIKWNIEKRLEFLDAIKTGKMPGWGGPHTGAVATYGLKRLDSHFSLNNAIKGIGLAPADTNLDHAIELLESNFGKSMAEKMEVLKSLYEIESFFDWRKQTSLELYAQPDFETHTFLNIMANPVATIVYTDLPSFELRTIARIVHHDNPDVLPSERKLVRFVNLAHEFMHGKFERKFPLLLFYLIEEFDNTPGSKRGIRTVPPLPLE